MPPRYTFSLLALLGPLACGRVDDFDRTTGVLHDPDGSVATLAALAHESSVWIGEIETVVTYPDVSTVYPPPYPWPREKVVLVLDALADGIAGTVTFGEGPPLPLPDGLETNPPQAQRPRLPLPMVLSNPIAGFEYSLVYSTMHGTHLSLGFLGSETWRDWCARQPPHTGDIYYPRSDTGTPSALICTCDETECEVVHGTVRRVDLTVNGNTMEGELSGGIDFWDQSDSPSLRLQLVE